MTITMARTAGRPHLAEWLVAMGPVLHKLDYGGRLLVVDARHGEASAMAAAYPLATVAETDTSTHGDVAGSGVEATDFDLVCLFAGLGGVAEPVETARWALGRLHDAGAVMVVEPFAGDAGVRGPVAVGRSLLDAGASEVRVVHTSSDVYVLDGRPGRAD